MENKKVPIILSIAEICAMTLLVIFDVFLPSLLIIVVGVAFLLSRKDKTDMFNAKVWVKPFRFCLIGFTFACLLSIIDYGFVIPLLNHLTHQTQNMSPFQTLKGNTGMLLLLLAYSWTFAAVGEEIAYRGFFQNRIISIFTSKTLGTVIAVAATSILFGFMHREQGIVGMVNTTFDAVFFSIVRYRFKSVWASVLVHGFSNTIGLVAFYFAGPLYGLW